MNARFFATALAAGLLTTVITANAQVTGGALNPRTASDLPQRIAAAKAAFPAVLASALSSESIRAMIDKIQKTPPPPAGTLTNFDNISAPCLFLQTEPLRGVEQFAAFAATPTNGGGIVNQCGNWGIDAHSPPNFLGFNLNATYAEGGVPELPELIVFERADKISVSLWVCGGFEPGFPVAIAAVGPGGVQGVVTVTTTSVWQQVTVTGTGIQAIALVGNPDALMVDDIQATPVP